MAGHHGRPALGCPKPWDRPRVCFPPSRSSVLAAERPGAELTCSNDRPKSRDQKWGLGLPNGEEGAGREDGDTQHNAASCSRSNSKTQCSHGHGAHRWRLMHIDTGAPTLRKTPKMKRRASGQREREGGS